MCSFRHAIARCMPRPASDFSVSFDEKFRGWARFSVILRFNSGNGPKLVFKFDWILSKRNLIKIWIWSEFMCNRSFLIEKEKFRAHRNASKFGTLAGISVISYVPAFDWHGACLRRYLPAYPVDFDVTINIYFLLALLPPPQKKKLLEKWIGVYYNDGFLCESTCDSTMSCGERWPCKQSTSVHVCTAADVVCTKGLMGIRTTRVLFFFVAKWLVFMSFDAQHSSSWGSSQIIFVN